MTGSTPPDFGPMEDETQKCPICDCDVSVNPRYSRYLCRGCRCWAGEARFGGIVIQALRPGEERPGRVDY